MRRLVLIAAAVTAATVALPAVVGGVIERRVTRHAELISASGLLAVTVHDYERGWLSSAANIDIGIAEGYRERLAEALSRNAAAAEPASDLSAALARTLTLNLDLRHGPITISDGLHAGLASAAVRLDPQTEGLERLLARLATAYLFEIRTRSGFTGASRFDAEVPALAFEGADAAFSLSGLTAGGTYDLADGRIVADARAASITMASEPMTLTAEDLTLGGDYRLISGPLWEGAARLALQRLTLLNATPIGPPHIEADRAGFTASMSLNDTRERLDIDASYFIETLSGDDLSLADARLDVALHGVSVAAVEAYNRIAQALALQPDATAWLMPDLRDAVYALLAAEPAMRLGPLSLVWNGDALRAVVRITTDTEMLPRQVAFSMSDRSLWTRLFAVQAEMDIAPNLAERLAVEASRHQLRTSGLALTPDALDAMAAAQGAGLLRLLTARGLIDSAGPGYRTELAYANGILEVNGREIPLGRPF